MYMYMYLCIKNGSEKWSQSVFGVKQYHKYLCKLILNNMCCVHSQLAYTWKHSNTKANPHIIYFKMKPLVPSF